MKIALIYHSVFPVQGYGGTERVVWWLAKGLYEKGVDVTLICAPKSHCPYAKVTSADFSKPVDPKGFDLLHHFNTPNHLPESPYLVTIGGNGKPGETFLQNTVFVSRNHAERHGATAFVHNGLDPEEYRFSPVKKDYLVFLAKASWRVKNVRGAIRFARTSHHELHVLGGKRLFLNHFRKVHWKGNVGQPEKAKELEFSKGLLFPVLWHEPFGIAVTEALVSGTPVLATAFGSLPELISKEVGKLCTSEEDFLEGIETLSSFSPEACRERVMQLFHYQKMTERYLEYYEKVMRGESLNAGVPKAPEVLPFPSHFAIPHRTA